MIKIIQKFRLYNNINSLIETNNQAITNNILKHNQLYIKKDNLTYQTLNSNKLGISNTKIFQNDLTISLTTYGERIFQVYLTIESIMQGSIKPNRLLLWLDSSFKNKKLPQTLINQQKRGLKIKYCDDILSYKKLIPTLLTYPNDIIITIDDDAIYDFDFVENLTNSYINHPKSINANRIHKITFNTLGQINKYENWQKTIANTEEISNLFFPVGCGGILYPPGCFDNEVFNQKVFMDICQFADDVWFYAMAKRNNTQIIKAHTKSNLGEDYIDIDFEHKDGLMQNNWNGGNDKQILAVFTKYNIYDIIKDSII